VYSKLSRSGQAKVFPLDKVVADEHKPGILLSLLLMLVALFSYVGFCAGAVSKSSPLREHCGAIMNACQAAVLGAMRNLRVEDVPADPSLDVMIKVFTDRVEEQQPTDESQRKLRPSTAAENIRKQLKNQPYEARVFSATARFKGSVERKDVLHRTQLLISKADVEQANSIEFRLVSDGCRSTKSGSLSNRSWYLVHLEMLPAGDQSGVIINDRGVVPRRICRPFYVCGSSRTRQARPCYNSYSCAGCSCGGGSWEAQSRMLRSRPLRSQPVRLVCSRLYLR